MRHLLAERRFVPAPMRHVTFRWLWVSMGMSYAGDRLQQLAQSWLVATITSSALAVGGIGALGSLPLLFLPLGGVVADQVNRRRLIVVGQLIGAISTAIIALLVLADRVAVWHIYAWAFVNGMILLVSRPSYKVVLTESVPPDEVRSAVAINSMTETAALVAVNGGGSVLLELLGLPLAFVLNTVTYLTAAGSLWHLRDLGQLPEGRRGKLSSRRVLSELIEGLTYLVREPALLHPILLTFVMVVVASPAMGLLAAIVEAQAGSIVDLGVLAAAFSVGAFGGAAYAGARSAGGNPTRRYAFYGLVVAGALALFAWLPTGVFSLVPLAVMGFVMFAQAVWNTSRIRYKADAAYQARLQAITSMAFTLGSSAGMLWGGIAIDRFGIVALFWGAMALGAFSAIIAIVMVWFPVIYRD